MGVLSAALLVACSSTPTPAASQGQAQNQSAGGNFVRTPGGGQPTVSADTATPTPAEKPQSAPTPAVIHPTLTVTAGGVQAAVPVDISAVFETNPRMYVGLCNTPATYKFIGSITSSAAGAVTYHFTRSDGYSEKPQTLTFSAPGTQTIATSWTMVGQPQHVVRGWVSLVIDSPYSLPLAKSAFTMNCVQGAF